MENLSKSKQEALTRLATPVIERILGSLMGPELMEPSSTVPLGGKVHLSGIGQVSVHDLRVELARRQ